jgi:ATP-dependent Lon protease
MKDLNLGIIIPILDIVLLPGIEYTLNLSNLNEASLNYLGDENISNIALALKNKSDNLSEDDFNKIGVTFDILNIEKTFKGHELKIKVLERVEINSLKLNNGFIIGEYNEAPDVIDLSETNIDEIITSIKKTTYELSKDFNGAEEYIDKINKINDINELIAYIAKLMPLSYKQKYELLKLQSLKERSLYFLDYLLKEKESIKFKLEVAEKLSEKSNKRYRESILREQLKAIQNELNEDDKDSKNNKDYLSKIEAAGMPDDIKEIAMDELNKLKNQSPSSSDYNITRNYLDLLVKLPWKDPEEKNIDLKEAKDILNKDHYGLEKIKERIIQHLAVMKLKKDKSGSILLLVGPPGTGKTSLGKSIAEVLKRKYIRLSLGGVRDEAEIRGHRRTYVGAMPGRIIESIKKAGEKDPVMVLDEVDKLTHDYNGDPASALLEVLDPEQNNTFTDHYLDAPYDLSNVFFIATANSLSGIPRPLLDRMEVIEISSYTANEKFHIAKEHLIPEVLKDHGLTDNNLNINDSALKSIISDYTLEAGVRGLKKQIAAIARVASEKIALGEIEDTFSVKKGDLVKLLGRQVSTHEKAQKDNPAGVVTGLAWTSVGGEILFIEATHMPGSGQTILTGQLGDVMKESARISLSLLKSRLPLNSFNFKERDIHIHVPSGSVPKDGPSAGITMFTALASLATGIKVNPKLAMTGEITLRGAVLPIGGLKEKLIAADRAGIKKELIPKDNLIDLKDSPSEVIDNLQIKAVETVEDVLKETLGISLPKLDDLIDSNELLERTFSLAK